jgi:hypothetical protein
MIRTIIQAGTCGFATTVTARSEDQQHVTLAIESGCEKIRGLAADLAPTIDAYQEIGNGHEGVLLKAARQHLKSCCSGCVVPSGLFKTVQVAGGVALPAVASVVIEMQEEERRRC